MDSEESGPNEVMDTLYDTRFWNDEDVSYWKLLIFFKIIIPKLLCFNQMVYLSNCTELYFYISF